MKAHVPFSVIGGKPLLNHTSTAAFDWFGVVGAAPFCVSRNVHTEPVKFPGRRISTTLISLPSASPFPGTSTQQSTVDSVSQPELGIPVCLHPPNYDPHFIIHDPYTTTRDSPSCIPRVLPSRFQHGTIHSWRFPTHGLAAFTTGFFLICGNC